MGNILFGRKAPAKRAHRPIELYQTRHPDEVNAALEREGFFRMTKKTVAKAGVANWSVGALAEEQAAGDEGVDEDGDDDDDDGDEEELTAAERAKRVKDLQSARMTVRTRVVNALYTAAPQEEKDAIAEIIEQEKKDLAEKAKATETEREDGAGRDPTPEELQRSIDDLPATMLKVHKVIHKKAGWLSFTVSGGPNPRHGGGLSMKLQFYGQTPAGNDFEAAHGNLEEALCKPWQAFLKRCFPPAMRRARALPELEPVETILPSLENLFRLPEDKTAGEAQPATQAKTKRVKPKRVKKKKVPKSSLAVEADAPDSSEENDALDAGAERLRSKVSTEAGLFDDDDDLDLGLDLGADDADFGLDLGADDANTVPDNDRTMDTPPSTMWPAGMGPPSSPGTAAAAAAAERGLAHAIEQGAGDGGPTYVNAHVPIDPALLTPVRAPPTRPAPRPTFKGATAVANTAPSDNVFLGAPPSESSGHGDAVRPPNLFFGGPANGNGFSFTFPPTSTQPLNRLFGTFREHMSDSPTRMSLGQRLGAALALGAARGSAGAQAASVQAAGAPNVVVQAAGAPNVVREQATGPTIAARIAMGAMGTTSVTPATCVPPPPPPPPFFAQSRPMAKQPTAPKEKPVVVVRKAVGKKKAAGSKGKAAVKVSAKVAKKKQAARRGAGPEGEDEGGMGEDDGQVLADTTNTASNSAPSAPPVHTAPSAPPVHIMTMGNETRDYNRRVDAERAEREKKAKAKKVDPQTHGVYVLPAPRCSRTRRPVTLPDNSDLIMPVKLTREAQRKKKEDALLKSLEVSLGKRPAPEEAAAPPAKRTKRSSAAAPVAKKATAAKKTHGVYVLPAPRCSRTRRPVTLPDNSDLIMPVKLTREAQRKKKEDALLKSLEVSLGKRPAPEEAAAPPAKRTKRSSAAAPVAKKATAAKKVGSGSTRLLCGSTRGAAQPASFPVVCDYFVVVGLMRWGKNERPGGIETRTSTKQVFIAKLLDNRYTRRPSGSKASGEEVTAGSRCPEREAVGWARWRQRAAAVGSGGGGQRRRWAAAAVGDGQAAVGDGQAAVGWLGAAGSGGGGGLGAAGSGGGQGDRQAAGAGRQRRAWRIEGRVVVGPIGCWRGKGGLVPQGVRRWSAGGREGGQGQAGRGETAGHLGAHSGWTAGGAISRQNLGGGWNRGGRNVGSKRSDELSRVDKVILEAKEQCSKETERLGGREGSSGQFGGGAGRGEVEEPRRPLVCTDQGAHAPRQR
ncbi:hypothetical protein C8R47DRAFT_1078764 [Mycena vitilis]|nr:hypothetical protein C8R47DRAFT_1078764 [Mycena vitilis]